MLGNDVVDLEDPETRREAVHRRFEDRVFTDGERREIERSGSPTRMRWVLWAAKEAAYKAVRAERPETIFSPRRFEVVTTSPGSAVVRHVADTAPLEVDLCFGMRARRPDEESAPGPAYVHAIARRLLRRGLQVNAIADRQGIDASRAVRSLARAMLARRLRVTAEELTIGRHASGAPALLWREREAVASLSFSHHGRFVAFACELFAARERSFA